MACDCIEQTNARMKEKGMNSQLSVSCLLSGPSAGQARITIPTTWTDRPKSGNGLTRREPPALLLTHCPFCFIPYEEDTKEIAPIRRPAR